MFHAINKDFRQIGKEREIDHNISVGTVWEG